MFRLSHLAWRLSSIFVGATPLLTEAENNLRATGVALALMLALAGGVLIDAVLRFLTGSEPAQARVQPEALVVLDGWGWEDTHETLNTFCWGPDGWLYGCHGVFTHSRVGKPGTPDAERVRVYGPEARAFLGSAHITAGELIADRLLTPPEVQALLAC